MADTCMSDAPSHARVTWTSEAAEPQPVLLRRARPDEPCAMFHVPIADVAVDGLGPLWTEDTPCTEDKSTENTRTENTGTENTGTESEPHPAPTAYNTAELPCGHAFSAAALAVHFATNDMRCPVCRRGPLHAAEISGFAPAMQPDLARIKLAMRAREHVDRASESFGVDLNLDALIRDFLFEIYMQWAPAEPARAPDRSVRLTSPVRLDQADAPGANTTDNYATHRSFQRKFNLNLNQMQPGQHIMCLGLTHPLMPDAARSAMFDRTALLAAADAGTRIALARNVGFVKPVRTDAGIALTLHLHTDYLAMACVQVMLNWDRHTRGS
jgi:hypothetical protein